MDKSKQPSSIYATIAGFNTEYYVPAVTIPYDQWANYVASGDNTLYGDAIIPGGTVDDGAVYAGHVRQNPWTAGYL